MFDTKGYQTDKKPIFEYQLISYVLHGQCQTGVYEHEDDWFRFSLLYFTKNRILTKGIFIFLNGVIFLMVRDI